MEYFIHNIEQTKYKNIIVEQNSTFHKDYSFIEKMNGWSIDYQTYFIIMKLLELLLPKNILELGYGYSTTLFQQYAQFYKCQHTVIENDQQWINYFNDINNFTFTGKILIKKLETIKFNKKYDILQYSNFRNGLGKKYDFILIDGPKGSKKLSRPNILKIFDLFDENFTIVVHDIHRSGEQLLVNKIKDNFKQCFLYSYDRCSVITTFKLNDFNKQQIMI